MNYGDLLKDALRITWRNRFLWFFGLFGTVVGGGAVSIPQGTGGGAVPQGAGDQPLPDRPFPEAGELIAPAREWVSDNFGILLLAAAALLVLWLLIFALRVLCAGALTEGVAAIDRGEARGFASVFRAGLATFWRVLGLVVLLSLLWTGLIALVGVPMVLLFLSTAPEDPLSKLAAVGDGFSFASLLLFLIFVPVGIVGQYALRETVLGGAGVFAALRGGYGLLRRHLGRSLVVWFIQVVVGVGVGIVAGLAILILTAILVLPVVFVGFLMDVGFAVWVLLGAGGFALILALALVVTAALGTFYHSYWTLAYLRLRSVPEDVPARNLPMGGSRR